MEIHNNDNEKVIILKKGYPGVSKTYTIICRTKNTLSIKNRFFRFKFRFWNNRIIDGKPVGKKRFTILFGPFKIKIDNGDFEIGTHNTYLRIIY